MSKSAVEKISSLERFGSVLGLERIRELLNVLGQPEKDLQIIHVGGTNGKGSVCRYIYSVLEENGYKTGIYTSPYLESFNERIAFDGCDISDDELEKYTDVVMAAIKKTTDRGHDSPTEFEAVTAIALLYFKEKKADFVILEVGLGGRGDSTNVIEKPLISVITSIDYDHMDRLGDTLSQIAFEKAGIIKKGVPVIINVGDKEAAKPIAIKAYEEDAVLCDGSRLKPVITHMSPAGQTFSLNIYGTAYNDVEISMIGRHQAENAKTALMVLENLRKRRLVKVDRERVYLGMKKAIQPGRLEIFRGKPLMVLDGAHNKGGSLALAAALDDYFPGAKILAVIGILADKDRAAIIKPLAGRISEAIATEPDNLRKLDAAVLADELGRAGIPAAAIPDPEKALKESIMRKDGFDVIIYTGSLYLIGEIRRMLRDGK